MAVSISASGSGLTISWSWSSSELLKTWSVSISGIGEVDQGISAVSGNGSYTVASYGTYTVSIGGITGGDVAVSASSLPITLTSPDVACRRDIKKSDVATPYNYDYTQFTPGITITVWHPTLSGYEYIGFDTNAPQSTDTTLVVPDSDFYILWFYEVETPPTTFSCSITSEKPTTATISAQLSYGDPDYSYARQLRIFWDDQLQFTLTSAESSGATATWEETLENLIPNTTYNWIATVYYRSPGGWTASSYSQTGSFTTPPGTVIYIYATKSVNGTNVTQWWPAQPYIYANGQWNPATAYIYANGHWNPQ